jgi:hypothetical protein
MNIAAPRKLVKEALRRMSEAVENRRYLDFIHLNNKK